MQQPPPTSENWCTSRVPALELSALTPDAASVLPRRVYDDNDAASTSGARRRTSASKIGGDAKWLRRE